MINVNELTNVHIGILTGCERGTFTLGFNGPLRLVDAFGELLFGGLIRRTDDGAAYELTDEGESALRSIERAMTQSTPSEE